MQVKNKFFAYTYVRQVREYATQLAIRGNEIYKATAV